MYSKTQQLKKHRTPNPKKMPQVEYRAYVDFVNELAGGMCQCGCGRPASQIHHSMFGAGGRDDRFLVSICAEDHYTIHHGTDTDEAQRLRLLCKGIGRSNWKEYCE